MTTTLFGRTVHEATRLRWRILLCGEIGSLIGVTLVWGMMMTTAYLYFPWQSFLYYRSRREFGHLSVRAVSGNWLTK